ncbi:DUF2254 domain-containing protein [Variovorax sp. LjRoot84]|uniref:DUF2254 family protein n=1 Tax=Variovorax sp. LjRoot84 TaxID=3342340 RepID=UPI003ECE5325
MDHVKFALRLLVALFFITLIFFWLEAAWDLSHAIDPATGEAVRLSQLRATPAMVRSLSSSFAGAYNTLIALLLTFISLAIPITANLYTPKLIEIFIRDRINLFVLCTCAILAAHNLFAFSLSFDQWTGQLPFAIAVAGAIFGWLLLLPYYFYVVSFIDPLTIIKRVRNSLMHELDDAAAGKYSVAVSQHRVNQKIANLGSVLLRAADRADRDVTFDAIQTHMLELARLRDVKARLPEKFFQVSNDLLVGLSGDATDILSEARIWMEHRIAIQLVLAFKSVLGKMPDGVSAMAQAVKNAAHEEACRRNDAVFDLLVRVLNCFTREAIKKKENASVFNVVYSYKALIRRLLSDRPEQVPRLVRYLRFYAEYARMQGLPFIYELVSYELSELTERAYERKAAPARELLDAVLAFDGAAQSVGLVKSRAILAAYFLECGLTQELELLEASLRGVTPAVIEKAKHGILSVQDRVFWELNDRGLNFDFVEPQRRTRVTEVFERLKANTG